jgi:GT2 family glycosyltransferase
MKVATPSDRGPSSLALVVCTRSYPPHVSTLVRAVLSDLSGPATVVVVDQADECRRRGVDEFLQDHRVFNVHDRGVGLARARNLGMETAAATGARFVAFTDDDCTPTPGWLGALARPLLADPTVGIVFGRTVPALPTPADGVIPHYSPACEAVYRGMASKALVHGMGACMAVRVDAWRMVGGFDECLGAGTTLASADENDLCTRLLRAGFAAAETSRAVVVHHGVRHGDAADAVVAGYMRGTGAASAKMLRLCGWSSVRPLAAMACRWLRGGVAVDMGPRPRRWHRLRHFLRGASIGFTRAIEPRTGRFTAGGRTPHVPA